jgi:hypothetical protein
VAREPERHFYRTRSQRQIRVSAATCSYLQDAVHRRAGGEGLLAPPEGLTQLDERPNEQAERGSTSECAQVVSADPPDLVEPLQHAVGISHVVDVAGALDFGGARQVDPDRDDEDHEVKHERCTVPGEYWLWRRRRGGAVRPGR